MTKMGILDHRKGKTLLSETQIYAKFAKWLEKSDKEMVGLENQIKSATEEYQRFLIKESRKKDFLRTFIVMCELAFQNIDAEKEKTYLFSLEPNYKQYLKDGNVDNKLKKEFADYKVSLSNKAKLSKKDEKSWEIVDSKKRYGIKDTDTQLNIHEKLLRDLTQTEC